MDVDIALKRLKEMPVDPRLEDMGKCVLAGAGESDDALSHGVLGLAACLAMGVGLLGSAIPGGAEAVVLTAPVDTVPALAPSSLLGGSE